MPAIPSLDTPFFSDLDRHFARFLGRFGGDELCLLAAALLSRAVRAGAVCLDLGVPDVALDFPWPALAEWREALAQSRAVGAPGEGTPLVLDTAGRLYLRRYFDYQQNLAAAIRARAFADEADDENSADVAVARALRRRFSVISGGPGTGKTTAVVRLLAELLPANPALTFALAAPTGKAAARLEEAVRTGFARLGFEEYSSRIPRAATLHRLLGSRPHSAQFRYEKKRPLPLDLLIVDEASMLPLPLVSRLFDALPERARVVLLGDRDQLASVEPGSVLADIVDAALAENGPLSGALSVLKTNYRFGNESCIYQLAEAVRTGDAAAALALLANPDDALASAPLPSVEQLSRQLREPVLEGYAPLFSAPNPAAALAALGRFRILTPLRQGPLGVEELNRRVAGILRDAGYISHAAFYSGLPILVTENAADLGLFNGDTGVLFPDPESGEERLWAWFPGGEGLRRFAPARLPAHEPAWVMSVHKSQGSEFERVLLLLPGHDSPVLTRELLYTGLTRAREHVTLWATPDALQKTLTRRAVRSSGLRDALTVGA